MNQFNFTSSWDKLAPSTRLKYLAQGNPRVPRNYNSQVDRHIVFVVNQEKELRRVNENFDARRVQFRSWSRLAPQTRLAMYEHSDPRVPSDYDPEQDEVLLVTPRVKRAEVLNPHSPLSLSSPEGIAARAAARRKAERQLEAQRRARFQEETKELSASELKQLHSTLLLDADSDEELWLLAQLKEKLQQLSASPEAPSSIEEQPSTSSLRRSE